MNDNDMITIEQFVYVFNINDEGYEFLTESEGAHCWVQNYEQNEWVLCIDGKNCFEPFVFDLTDAEIRFENGMFIIHLANGRYIRVLVLKRVEEIDFPSTEWAAKQIVKS